MATTESEQEQPVSEESEQGPVRSFLGELPLGRVKDELQDAVKSRGQHAIDSMTQRLRDFAEGGGGGVAKEAVEESTEAATEGKSPVGGALSGGLSGLKDKAKNALTGGGSNGSAADKATTIVEDIDVGVPVSVAYNAWTEYHQYPEFMKKVERGKQDGKQVDFKAQVFWSHREWTATIHEQVPDKRIIWRSTGEKGHVDGSVTFHELGPDLTRILVVLEYYPQGLFERTGNLWRAQGRRARLELKHFRRHVMMNVAPDMDQVEGWRGVIRDGEVEEEHEDVVAREQEEQEQDEGREESEEDYADEEPAEDEEASDEEDYDDEQEPADEEPAEDEEASDEEDYVDEEEPAEDEEAADEDYVDEEEPAEDEELLDEEEPPEEDQDER